MFKLMVIVCSEGTISGKQSRLDSCEKILSSLMITIMYVLIRLDHCNMQMTLVWIFDLL